MSNFSVRVAGTAKGEPETVRVIAQGRCIFDFSWQHGKDVCDALRDAITKQEDREVRAGSDVVKFVVNEFPAVGAYNSGPGTVFKVGWVKNGNIMFDVSIEDARAMWKTIRHAVLRAEEIEKHEQVSMDAAILDRSGAPVGIANDRRIREEARKLATSDRTLRRAMTNSIKSAEVLGPPELSTKPLTPEQKFNRMGALARRELLRKLANDPAVKGGGSN